MTTPFLRCPVLIDSKDDLIKNAVDLATFSKKSEDRYFQRAEIFKNDGFVETRIDNLFRKNPEPTPRVEVVDLPSFEVEARPTAVDAVLELIWRNAELEWANAQKKAEVIPAPTYIVVEEAHNLIPQESVDYFARKLRDKFRRIAAEGRKYGLFLIICTQRADKIDRFVVSECENVAVMKLGSPSVLNKAKKAFGLEGLSKSDLARCLKFDGGDALLMGQWAQQPLLLHGGLRRSKEGTKRMREDWATPTPEIGNILEGS